MSTPTPAIKVTRLTRKHRKYKRGGGSSLQRAFVSAFIDGYLVTRSAGKPWSCSCPSDNCGHPDTFASILAPDILADLDGDEQ
ncbi:hypothetical protein [Janibacter hoylei]|uniref:hypothetical protein n=1 Tax=Janibacter hoylei TaxID=364298 RepID=UPI0021A3E06D|nr:hypothetical protein [Janibacter hoylei]MCT1618492.1 hypothetical protein [Janibacter hoylei]MCT2294086.1 hypothetical protein [Janibacter hoylei]